MNAQWDSWLHRSVPFLDEMYRIVKNASERGTLAGLQPGILQQGDHFHDVRVRRDRRSRLYGSHGHPFF